MWIAYFLLQVCLWVALKRMVGVFGAIEVQDPWEHHRQKGMPLFPGPPCKLCTQQRQVSVGWASDSGTMCSSDTRVNTAQVGLLCVVPPTHALWLWLGLIWVTERSPMVAFPLHFFYRVIHLFLCYWEFQKDVIKLAWNMRPLVVELLCVYLATLVFSWAN